MSNFPPWNGQQDAGYGQQMQMPAYQQRPVYQMQMLPAYQPQQYQQAQPQQPQEQFYCRPVASAEEARAVPVDFNGKPMLFPQLNAGRIYVKIFDPGSGSAIFREFRMAEPEAETQTPAVAFAPMSAVEQLSQTVAELQNEVRQLKGGGKKKTQQEAIANDE